MEDAMMIFEGACPNCQSENLTDIKVECHPDQAECWGTDGITIETNDKMARGFGSMRGNDDWIATRMTIYTCKCADCGASHYLEQNVTGDWM